MTKGVRFLQVLALCFAASLTVLAAPGRIDHGGGVYRPDRLLIVPKPGSGPTLESLHKGKGHKVKRHFEQLGVDVLTLGGGKDPVAAAREYIASGLVEYAEPDYRIHASDVPNDPEFAKCWGMNNTGQSGGTAEADIRAETAWSSQRSASNVIVAVIDSGVRYTHEDLAANMWRNPRESKNGKDDDGNGIVDDVYGFNAMTGSGDPMDDFGHGTHVAGTIGAVGNNGKGVAGVCWNVQIMALKFMDSEGWGDTSDAIACINYARKNGAKVINASWGSPDNSYALRNAINAARSGAGIVFVTAAGNELENNDAVPNYPANYSLDNVVSVAAINHFGVLDSYYSNWGRTTVDLAAPGTEIYSTSINGDHAYQYMTGTSMASPHVAGAVALLWAAYPQESYKQIIQRLYAGVDKVPSLKGKCVTEGRLNLANLFPHRWTVATDQVGEGTVTVLTNSPSLTEGSTVELLATPAPGYRFSGWSGDLAGMSNPAELRVDANKHVTATFVKIGPEPVGSPRLIANVIYSGGAIHIDLAESNPDLVIETSTNLSEWEPLEQVTRDGNRISTLKGSERQRFYRVRQP